VVDGNVYRVLARYFGISTPINSTKGIKEFKQLAQSLIDIKNPGTHNQAMMEFGALVCKPKIPECNSCSINKICKSYKLKKKFKSSKKTKILKKNYDIFCYLNKEKKK
jgi:A/G-specific adenine glycosylase